MVVTESGKTMLVSPVHPPKALPPILASPFGRITEVSPVH